MPLDNSTYSAIEAALAETERSGLQLVLDIRTVLAGLAMALILITQGVERGAFGASFAFGFLLIGLIYRAVVAARRDQIWMRYAFVLLDILLLATIAALVPLASEGDVPQIFVFRVYSFSVFFFVLATSALSLSPGLVLWSGGAILTATWAAWGWIVASMERRVSWADYGADPTAENYIRVVLDPDNIHLANRVSESLVLVLTALVTAAAVQRARTLLRQQIISERERAEVSEVFGRFVPEEVAETLSHSDGVLPPSSHTASVMFVDIVGFSTISETMVPEEITALADAFFDEVGLVASNHRGVCISLIGDAALIAFNAPLENSTHASSAIAAAQELLKRSSTGTFEGRQLSIRIGIATGFVSAGTVGGRGRRTYTLYGDTVNLAQRLEALNKEMGTSLLVDKTTWESAGRPSDLIPAGETLVKGRSALEQIFTVNFAKSSPNSTSL